MIEWRTTATKAGWHWALAAAAWLSLAIGAQAVSAQQSSSGAWPATTQPDRNTGVPANTTVVPRSAGETKSNAGLSEVTLMAYLTDDGQRIDQGLVWRAYKEQAGSPTARPKIVGTWREASPSVRLAPGEYMVNVAFGRAHMTRRISVKPGGSTEARFVLNAGGLRVTALVGAGEAAPERTISYDIYSGDVDQLGNRTKAIGGLRPGVIIRLNAGIYHVVSTYGDVNATVKADVTVEAGKLTEATLHHAGARVTFKLVMRTGGEAQADAQWSVFDAQGELVKESVGALPTHILGPGSYAVMAKHSGRSFRREFKVQASDPMQVEVVMQ